jgi:hypothetical protein
MSSAAGKESPQNKIYRLRALGTWIGVIYAFAVCYIAMFSYHWSHAWETALPALLAFLPMAFVFSAQSHIQSLKQLKYLTERIEKLEELSRKS